MLFSLPVAVLFSFLCHYVIIFFYMPMGRVTSAAARDVKAMISAELTLPTLLISA